MEDMDALAEVQYLLERMLDLALRASMEECGDEQRARLQKGIAFLRARIEQIEKDHQ
ncbi:hypothetical protein AALC17_12855 [Oscillospiraceae bacterium 38-13]|jgi:flagellin-like hook-associated protein FlgL